MEKLKQWQMTELKKEFTLVESDLPAITAEEAIVKVAGCGVCHTDLSFWHDGVKTKKEMPFTLALIAFASNPFELMVASTPFFLA